MESHGLNGPAESLPVVLDIGTGTGLLAMLAIKAGAPSVIGEGQLLFSATAPRTSRSILGAAGCWAARLGPRGTCLQIMHDSGIQCPTFFSAGCERELTLALTACSVAAANECGGGLDVANTVSRQLLVGEGQQMSCKAALVVHEVFGTDPLSEQILPTMQHAKECLAAPSALFMPARFRAVAALARCEGLRQTYRHAPDRVACGADLSPLLCWSPWKVCRWVLWRIGLLYAGDQGIIVLLSDCPPLPLNIGPPTLLRSRWMPYQCPAWICFRSQCQSSHSTCRRHWSCRAQDQWQSHSAPQHQ